MTATASAPAPVQFSSMSSLSHSPAAMTSASPYQLLPPPSSLAALGSGHPGSGSGSGSDSAAASHSFSSSGQQPQGSIGYSNMGMGTSSSGSTDQAQPSHGGYDYDYVYPPPPDALFGLLQPPSSGSAYPSHCFPPPSAYLSSSMPSTLYHGDTHHYDHHDLELELLAFYQHQQDHSALESFPISATTFPPASASPTLPSAAHSGAGSGSDDTASDSPQPFDPDLHLAPAATAIPASTAAATGARTKARSTAKRKSDSSAPVDPNSATPVINTRSTTHTALGPDAAQHIAKNRGQRWTERELNTLQAGVAKHGRNFVAIYNDHGPNGKVDTALARIPSVRAIHAKWLRLTMVERKLAKQQEKSAAAGGGGLGSVSQAVMPAGDGVGEFVEEDMRE